MKIIDISLTLKPSVLTYEGDPTFFMGCLSMVQHGNVDSYNFSALFMSTHIGTHLDSPLHVVPDAMDIANLALKSMCGPVRVIDLMGKGKKINSKILREYNLKGAKRVLLKTDNCKILDKSFCREYAHLTRDGARYLRRKVKTVLVGIDYLSIDSWPDPYPGFGFPAHHELLDGKDPVVVLEGIDLRHVNPGDYFLWCLPLKIAGADGSPARAVLVEME